MSYWDYEEPIWEPSEADELFGKIKSTLIDAAQTSVKADIEALKSENEYLKKRNKELESHAAQVSQKERDLQYKADNLMREVKNEFYNTAIDKLFEERIENVDIWTADYVAHEQPKCEHCNDNRVLTYTFPNGKTVSTQCDCAKLDYFYEPSLTTLQTLKYCVKPSKYSSERKYYMYDYKAYKQARTLYDDDCGWSEFKILHILDVFGDNAINLHKDRDYNEKLGFKTKEECQKYCDWLNEQKEG